VLSPAYFGSRFAESEWRVAFKNDPTGELGLLLPVMVQPCQAAGLMATRVAVNLVDVDEATARERLLAAVGPPGPRPTDAPFPGAERFPGAGPLTTNLGPRNRTFTGRDAALAALAALYERLHTSETPVAVLPVAAVYGLGGVGKTALVWEFAHRFASDYELIWWISADQPTTAAADLARLAERLGIPTDADQAAGDRLAVRPAPRPPPVAPGLRQRRTSRGPRRIAAGRRRRARAGHVTLVGVERRGRPGTPRRAGPRRVGGLPAAAQGLDRHHAVERAGRARR
jgi:hypothetical protein